MLCISLDSICSRNQYTDDPGPVIEELYRVAGGRDDILAEAVGVWAGCREGEAYTRVLVEALLKLPGVGEWAALGRKRRASQRGGMYFGM